MTNLSLVRRIIPNAVTTRVGGVMLKASKNSPSILFGVGVVGFSATIVMSSRATLKVGDILDDARKTLSDINEVRNDFELSAKHDYTEEVAQVDRVLVYRNTAIKLGRLYGPTVLVGTITIAAFTKAHFTQNSRIMALTAAYSSLERAYNSYRERVAKEIGEEREFELAHNVDIHREALESGSDLVPITTRDLNSSYLTRMFDTSSKAWLGSPDYNLIFVRAQQNYANDMLRSRGYLFLNEVFDNLGLSRTREGQIIGWRLAEGNVNYVDFGIFDASNESTRAFVNGEDKSVLLTFNPDGIIWDQI